MTVGVVASQDLLGAELTADPYPYYSLLREQDPVHYNEHQRAWLLTRYEDVGAAYLDPRLSSDRVRPLLDVLDGERLATMGPMLRILSSWMVVSDPPAHTRLRQLANAAFKQQRVAAMKEWIGDLVDTLLDDMIASGSRDFLASVAYPMPATVIATMLGAPVTESHLFQHWSDELALVAFGAGGDDRADRHHRALQAVTEMQSYLADLIDDARRSPGGSDMISVLLSAESMDGDLLSDDELVALATLLLFAGHETTTNLLCNALVVLSEHPDQLDMLRNDPGLIGGAVEEILRFEGPIKTIQRWITEDHERGGRQFRAGQRVFLINSAANRDGTVFENPDVFDIRRPTQPLHMAFGRGAHSCLGAQLARLEARIALPKILARLPELEVDGVVEFKPSVATRSVRGLQVRYQ